MGGARAPPAPPLATLLLPTRGGVLEDVLGLEDPTGKSLNRPLKKTDFLTALARVLICF